MMRIVKNAEEVKYENCKLSRLNKLNLKLIKNKTSRVPCRRDAWGTPANRSLSGQKACVNLNLDIY